ncbi:MAG: MFS transporter [Burkholderiales bacterium]|nr:MFS transporter [Burkholderiales bacterium]
MSDLRALRPVLPILIGASLMLTMSMGLRQSLGVFMPSLTRDIGISVSQFTLAIAVQNLVWGFLQPFSGALVVRIGYRRLMVAGAMLYVLGMALLATAQGMIGVTLGAGIAIGASMACNGPAIAMAVASRPVSAAIRSTVLGIVSAAGSLGALMAAPFGQALSQEFGWRVGLYGFVLMALVIVPAAWFAGKVDALPLPASVPGDTETRARVVAIRALKHPPFAVMTIAYFVCGMQLVFLTTHLPSYLDSCGLDPMLSAQALGVIGGFNVLGSLFFGWAGGRYNKLLLLGGIYTLRSLGIAWYFLSAATPANTLIFAAIMGFLWLGVGPLVAGYIGETFGLRWQAMLGGVAFMTHQIGSFVGAFGGGLAYDALGSYQLALQVGVSLGLAAGLVQMAFALSRPPNPPTLAPA